MADTNAAVVTTLAQYKANVRARAKALNEQVSKIPNIILNNLVHDSITAVRTMAGVTVDDDYKTTDELPAVDALVEALRYFYVDVSAINSTGWRNVQAFATDGREIPLFESSQFYGLISGYKGMSELNQALFAHVTSAQIDAVGKKLVIEAYYGTDVTKPTNIRLTYRRNPRKITDNALLLDLPEKLMPVAMDHTVVSMFRLKDEKPPMEEESRVRNYIKGQAERFGLEISGVSA